MDMIGSSNLQSALVLQAQSAFEQAASKLSLAEMQMVELRAQRLEGLQVHVAAVPRQVFPAHQTKSSGSNVGCSAGGGGGEVGAYLLNKAYLNAFTITCCVLVCNAARRNKLLLL